MDALLSRVGPPRAWIRYGLYVAVALITYFGTLFTRFPSDMLLGELYRQAEAAGVRFEAKRARLAFPAGLVLEEVRYPGMLFKFDAEGAPEPFEAQSVAITLGPGELFSTLLGKEYQWSTEARFWGGRVESSAALAKDNSKVQASLAVRRMPLKPWFQSVPLVFYFPKFIDLTGDISIDSTSTTPLMPGVPLPDFVKMEGDLRLRIDGFGLGAVETPVKLPAFPAGTLTVRLKIANGAIQVAQCGSEGGPNVVECLGNVQMVGAGAQDWRPDIQVRFRLDDTSLATAKEDAVANMMLSQIDVAKNPDNWYYYRLQGTMGSLRFSPNRGGQAVWQQTLTQSTKP